MADHMTTSKGDLESENARLRALLQKNGVNPEADTGPNLVGNFADLQRLGALVAAEGKTNVDEAVVVPPSADDDA